MDSGFDKTLKNIIDQRKTSEGKVVSYKESLELAKSLLEKYKNEILQNRDKDVDGFDNGELYTDFQKSIKHFMIEIPEDIKKHYSGHGITRNSGLDQLAGFLNIAANKAIKGYCGLIVGSDGYNAYTHGDFIILSKKDINLPVKEFSSKSREEESVFIEIDNGNLAWKANIGAMVVDVKYYPLVEELKKMFPEINIIKANELPKYFGIEK